MYIYIYICIVLPTEEIVCRGVPLRQAWTHATELVYTSAAGSDPRSGDWAVKATDASLRFPPPKPNPIFEIEPDLRNQNRYSQTR